MFATFVCKHCNQKITIDFSKLNSIPSHCNGCGSNFSNSHYIASFADKFLSLQRALHDLEFCSLSSSGPNLVYKSDMEALNDLYTHSTKEVQKLLTSILDKNFLMVYHDAKNEDLEALNQYLSKLNSLFEEKINLRNDIVEKLLLQDDN